MSMTTIERFMAKVRKTNSCWIWIGANTGNGYGHLRYKGKDWKAHRFSYKLAYGFIPNNKLVCHHCDVKPCIRPSHLFIGTHADNRQDAVNKGLFDNCIVRGENHGRAKMTWKKVRELRHRYSDGETELSLSKRFDIAKGNVWFIRKHITWKEA